MYLIFESLISTIDHRPQPTTKPFSPNQVGVDHRTQDLNAGNKQLQQ